MDKYQRHRVRRGLAQSALALLLPASLLFVYCGWVRHSVVEAACGAVVMAVLLGVLAEYDRYVRHSAPSLITNPYTGFTEEEERRSKLPVPELGSAVTEARLPLPDGRFLMAFQGGIHCGDLLFWTGPFRVSEEEAWRDAEYVLPHFIVAYRKFIDETIELLRRRGWPEAYEIEDDSGNSDDEGE